MANKIRDFVILFLSIICIFSPSHYSFAEHNDSANNQIKKEEINAGKVKHEEKFNAGKLIIEHISDAYDWHIVGHLSIPLPVILYSNESGLNIFLSNKFEHGHASYKGYKLVDGRIKAINEDGSINETLTAKTWDFSITKNTAALIISICLLLLIFIAIAKSYSRNKDKAPRGLQAFLEPLILFIRDDIAKASIGEKKYQKYLPFLLTIFFFILINNLLGLVPIFPGGTNLTGNIAITLSLAFLTFLITSFSGNKHYWRHILAMPGVPAWVLVLLTPIEILGVFLRPFVLMVRLFANITAGHIIALSFFSLIFIFAEMHVALGFGVSIMSLAFTVFMTLLELLVAFLQAYVFTLLSAIYFGSAVEENHHHEHGEEPTIVSA